MFCLLMPLVNANEPHKNDGLLRQSNPDIAGGESKNDDPPTS